MFMDSLKCAWLLACVTGHQLFDAMTPEMRQAVSLMEEVS
jgi:hypothetical protein